MATDNSSTWPANVTVLAVEPGKRTEAQASVTAGQHFDKTYLPNRCVSDSDQAKLNGNQVLFGFTLPADTDVKISVLPKDIKQSLNVYAYTQPSARYDLPNQTSSLWSLGSSSTASSSNGNGSTSSSSGTAGSSGTMSNKSGSNDIDCKTSFGGKSTVGKAVKGDERVIRFDGKKAPRNVVIGVAAPANATAGDFVVTVEATKD